MPRKSRRRLSCCSLNQSFNQDAPDRPPHQSSAETSDLDVTFADLGENDDTAERSEIRRHPSKSTHPLITPLMSSNRNRKRPSPSPYLTSGGVRRKQYTNDELSQIYKDCIVKAQQGKITQLNAWNLHLVDNIKEITDLNDLNSNRNSNTAVSNNTFARASHTIDAASKIYGYRVDSVHNKTYKVLGSIHQNQHPNDFDGDELDADRKKKRRQRNRNVGKATLCDTDKTYKLNETMKNLCVEVDALFHKTSSCFDEGGAKGLLMNTLYVQNGCDIVFDSSTKIEQNEDITNNGIQIDTQQIEDQEAIEKESQWMTQLVCETFADFDGFTQPIDTTSPDFDVSTQTKPANFTVDMKWIETTSICPLLNVFENQLNAITTHILCDPSVDPSPQRHDAGEADAAMFDGNHGAMDGYSDNDVIMDMPDFTIGGDDLNVQDLFHEELLTQAVAPQSMSMYNNQVQPQLMNVTMDGGDIQYIVGQNNGNFIGNMGVQPDLNNSMGFAFNHGQQIVCNLEREQRDVDGEYGDLHRKGIYKRGAMNLNAMNDMISKLENADFENLTSFFDTKKLGNWAGPDQWYHRRCLMTLKQTKAKTQSVIPHDERDDEEKHQQLHENKKAKRKKRTATRFDFMKIARGELIDEKEFEEPQRSFNTLTQAVLDKNRKTYHTLPKDLQIKPDMFIKLFHRENYSVWKHWLNQHRLRMMKRNEHIAMSGNADGDGDAVEHGRYEDGDIPMHEDEPQFLAQQAAAMAVIDQSVGADDEDNFQYNYNNALDTSHFVPNIGGNDGYEDNAFDFNLNGYDLVDIDPSKKFDKIKVEFATSAKKVNVRKLKLRLWDKIDTTLPDIMIESGDKENVQNNSNRNVDIDEDEDVDMDDNRNGGNNENENMLLTFQDTLDSLPNNISSAISIHMCFICLLHLANEKELQFVPKEKNEIGYEERGNFEIQYANADSVFEKDAQKINPIMVLGMQ